MIDIGKDLQNAFDDGYKQRDSEIVRCKDCKYRVRHHCNENYMLLCDDDDFCSMGERREANDEV